VRQVALLKIGATNNTVVLHDRDILLQNQLQYPWHDTIGCCEAQDLQISGT